MHAELGAEMQDLATSMHSAAAVSPETSEAKPAVVTGPGVVVNINGANPSVHVYQGVQALATIPHGANLEAPDTTKPGATSPRAPRGRPAAANPAVLGPPAAPAAPLQQVPEAATPPAVATPGVPATTARVANPAATAPPAVVAPGVTTTAAPIANPTAPVANPAAIAPPAVVAPGVPTTAAPLANPAAAAPPAVVAPGVPTTAAPIANPTAPVANPAAAAPPAVVAPGVPAATAAPLANPAATAPPAVVAPGAPAVPTNQQAPVGNLPVAGPPSFPVGNLQAPPPPELPPHPVLPAAAQQPLSAGELSNFVSKIDWQHWQPTTEKPKQEWQWEAEPVAAGVGTGGVGPVPATSPVAAVLGPSPAVIGDRRSVAFWRRLIRWDLHAGRTTPPPAPSALVGGPHPAASPGLASIGTVQGRCGAEMASGHPSALGTPAAFCPYCRWCCRCNANFPDGHCDATVVDVEDYGGPPGLVSCGTCQRDCSTCPQFGVLPVGHLVQRPTEDVNFTAAAGLGAGGGCPNGNCCDASLPQPLPWVPAPAPAPAPAFAPAAAPAPFPAFIFR